MANFMILKNKGISSLGKKNLLKYFLLLFVVGIFYQNCANQFQAINGLNAQNFSSMEAQKALSELHLRSSIGYQSNNKQVSFAQDPLFTDRMTLFLVVPASNEIIDNTLFSMTSGDAENDHILVSFSQNHQSILIERRSDPTNKLTYQVNLGAQFSRTVLAVNFKKKPQLEKFMLSGRVTNLVLLETGIAADFNFLIKEIQIDNSIQSILVGEDLTAYETNMISSMMAQQTGVPGYKIDFSLPDTEVTYPADEVETRAIAILKTRCATCHEQHGSWAGYSTNNYISQNLIVPGNPSASMIYQRITTSDSGRKMPPSGSLGANDPQIIREWILNIQNSD